MSNVSACVIAQSKGWTIHSYGDNEPTPIGRNLIITHTLARGATVSRFARRFTGKVRDWNGVSQPDLFIISNGLVWPNLSVGGSGCLVHMDMHTPRTNFRSTNVKTRPFTEIRHYSGTLHNDLIYGSQFMSGTYSVVGSNELHGWDARVSTAGGPK